MKKVSDDAIIDELYDVVSSPDQYDEFMHSLEDKLAVLREHNANKQSPTLKSHLDRASALLDALVPWRWPIDSGLQKLLATRIQAMMAIDETGTIVDANSAARVLYDLTRDTSIAHLPFAPEALNSLNAAVQQACLGNASSNQPNNVLRLKTIGDERSILVTVGKHFSAESRTLFAIVTTSDMSWPAHLRPILQDLFDLTRAELEILQLMVEGHRVDNIAKMRQCSVATVRTQLRAIFSKTDTASQMDCVRMVLGLAMLHDTEQGRQVAERIHASTDDTSYPRESQRQLFLLPDGRQIDYSVFGAPKGKPVLFYHDQAFGDVWFGRAVEEAIRSGLKIIAPLRPGFGRTTLYQGEASDPRRFAPDIVALIDHLKIDRTPMITLSSGLVHGLALAKLIPERIISISAAHPLLPVIDETDLEGTNGYNRLIPQTRLTFPGALRFLSKAGFAFVSTKGPEAFVKAVTRASPKDAEWTSRPDVLPILVQGLPVHREQGYLGNYGDIAYSDDWRDLLINAPVPVRLVIGEHDRNVQWGAAKRWAAELGHVSLHILPNSGYMVFHQQNGQFLKWVKDDLFAHA